MRTEDYFQIKKRRKIALWNIELKTTWNEINKLYSIYLKKAKSDKKSFVKINGKKISVKDVENFLRKIK